MALCSLLGGMALANAKLGAVHGLAGVIGGTADVPHGMACAAVLAPVVEANVRALRSGTARADHDPLDRYTEAARLLTGNPAATVEDGLAWIRETLTLLERTRPGRVRPQAPGRRRHRRQGPDLEQHAGQPRPLEPRRPGGHPAAGPLITVLARAEG